MGTKVLFVSHAYRGMLTVIFGTRRRCRHQCKKCAASHKCTSCQPLRPKVLMFSMFDDISIIDRAMKLGAMGYVSKQSEPDVLISAVTSIIKGRRYLEHNTAIELATFNLSHSGGNLTDLTQRELDIFLGIANGLCRKQVAESLNISEKTVSNVITQLKRKLELQTNAEFVHLAIKQGYIKIAS